MSWPLICMLQSPSRMTNNIKFYPTGNFFKGPRTILDQRPNLAASSSTRHDINPAQVLKESRTLSEKASQKKGSRGASSRTAISTPTHHRIKFRTRRRTCPVRCQIKQMYRTTYHHTADSPSRRLMRWRQSSATDAVVMRRSRKSIPKSRSRSLEWRM